MIMALTSTARSHASYRRLASRIVPIVSLVERIVVVNKTKAITST
jgi:hypothetical protein